MGKKKKKTVVRGLSPKHLDNNSCVYWLSFRLFLKTAEPKFALMTIGQSSAGVNETEDTLQKVH